MEEYVLGTGYDPGADGNIPMPVQEIASVGEACHDFTIARSKLSVVNLRKDLIRNIGMEHYQKTEHDISKLLHREFNGGIVTRKANLDLSDTSKVYTTLQQLEKDLFFGSDGVNPLVFTIAASELEKFKPVLEKLKTRFSLYDFNPYLTHDAYARPVPLGNPMAATIKYSAATTCDSGTAGSSGDVLKSAMAAGDFIMDNPLVTGKSYWGTWTIYTKSTPSGKYGGAKVQIRSHEVPMFEIELPTELTRSPSVNELSLMLDGVISGRTNDQIIISINKHLSSPSIRTFYTIFIGHIRTLYSIHPFIALKFIFIWKELGDMSQHLVAVTQKHLAGGTVDGLSSIAFLKRGVAISYMIACIKGLDHVRFRVAGTSHMLAGSPADMARRQADAAAAEAARLAAIAKRQEDKAAMKEAIRVAAAAERAEIENERTRAKAASNERRAARTGVRGAARKNKMVGGSRWKKTARKLRKYKNSNKTYKQKGGANISADDLIDWLIDALFDYSLAAAAGGGGGGLPATCSLFNVKDAPSPITSDYIDLTLVVLRPDGFPIFMDNEVLGLPLASILYILPQNLPADIRPADTATIIEDFLKSFNFTDEEITYISQRVAASSLAASPSSSLAQAPAPKVSNVIRKGTDSDKDKLQLLVDNYGAVIPEFEPTTPEIIPEEYSPVPEDFVFGSQPDLEPSTQTFEEEHHTQDQPTHNTTEISTFIESLSPDHLKQLKDYIIQAEAQAKVVGSGAGAMPFGTPERVQPRVNITTRRLTMLGEYMSRLLDKKGGGASAAAGGGASAAAGGGGGGGGEPVAPKFNPQEIQLLGEYIQQEEQKRILSGRKSPRESNFVPVEGRKSPKPHNLALAGGRGSPVPLGRGSPVPLGRGSPVPLGRRSPVLPRFPRRSRKNSTFRK